MKQFLNQKMCPNAVKNKRNENNSINPYYNNINAQADINYIEPHYQTNTLILDNNTQQQYHNNNNTNPVKHFKYIGHSSDKSLGKIKEKKSIKSSHSSIQQKHKLLSSFNISQQNSQVGNIEQVYVIDKNFQVKQLALIDNVTPQSQSNELLKSKSCLNNNTRSMNYHNDNFLHNSTQSSHDISIHNNNKSCDRFLLNNQRESTTTMLISNEEDINRLTKIKDEIESMIQLKKDLQNESSNNNLIAFSYTKTPFIKDYDKAKIVQLKQCSSPNTISKERQINHQHNYYKTGFIIDNDSEMNAEFRNKYEREKEKINEKINSPSYNYKNESPMENYSLRNRIPEAYENSMTMNMSINSKDKQYTYNMTNSDTLKNINNELKMMINNNNNNHVDENYKENHQGSLLNNNKTIIQKELHNSEDKKSNSNIHNNRYQDNYDKDIKLINSKEKNSNATDNDEIIHNHYIKNEIILRGKKSILSNNTNENNNSQEKKSKSNRKNFLIDQCIEEDNEEHDISGPMCKDEDDSNINDRKQKELRDYNNNKKGDVIEHQLIHEDDQQHQEDSNNINLESFKQILQSNNLQSKETNNQSHKEINKGAKCTCKKNLIKSASKCNYQCEKCLQEQSIITKSDNIELKSSYKTSARDIVEAKIEQFLKNQRKKSSSSSKKSIRMGIASIPLVYSDKKDKYFLESLLKLQKDLLNIPTIHNRLPSHLSPITTSNRKVLLTVDDSKVPYATISDEYYAKVIKKENIDLDPFYLKFPNNRTIKNTLCSSEIKHQHQKSECSLLKSKINSNELLNSKDTSYHHHRHSSSISSLNTPLNNYQTIQLDNDYHHLESPFKNSRVFKMFTSKHKKMI